MSRRQPVAATRVNIRSRVGNRRCNPKTRNLKSQTNPKAENRNDPKPPLAAAFSIPVSNSEFFFEIPMTGFLLIPHLRHLERVQVFHEFPSTGSLELGVLSFDAQKEAVTGSAGELRQIEDRVMRLRQSVEHEHRYQCRDRRDQYRELESH